MATLPDQLWFRHPERCWALGDVRQSHGTDVEVVDVMDGQLYTVPLSECHPCDPSHLLDSDDIARMNNMHEGPLLDLLSRRYYNDIIYTFTADILISINPYKHIPGLYDMLKGPFREKMTPHVFTVAERTYFAMLDEVNPSKKNQSIIVSGESGAGKTEACKHIMAYLAILSQQYSQNNRSSLQSMSNSSELENRSPSSLKSIEDKVVECNPFLEAFGNAKTVRNDNSSRFGKFVKIEYENGRILGARIRHYLLEKARVVSPNEGERNYHIFYQLVRGCTDAERSEMRLDAVEDFHYLVNEGLAVVSVPGVDDIEEFQLVRSSLATVGISSDLQLEIYRILAGVLHLGNVRFSENSAGESYLENPESAEFAGYLLGAPGLPQKLTQRLVKIKGHSSSYTLSLNQRQSAVTRDSLAKTVYERLFSWLIMRTNDTLSSPAPWHAFIGLLDIFGFEIFAVNSFEQLCINFANEKLQALFNHHIFVSEQNQYRLEGVDVRAISFSDNLPCVELIEKKPTGLLVLLDEVCFLGRDTTDAEYLEKLDRAHKNHSFYGVGGVANTPSSQNSGISRKRQRGVFSVLHFAGEVVYSVEGFIEKNNDTLYTDIEELMQASERQLVVDVFSDEVSNAHLANNGPSQSSVSRGEAPAVLLGAGSGPNMIPHPDLHIDIQSIIAHLAVSDSSNLQTVDSPAQKLEKRTTQRQKTQSVSTIASKFKAQLAALNDTLLSTSHNYVRCVKPNKTKSAHVFDAPMVLTQLLYAGVLETVRIRRQGFPFRETFPDFYRRIFRMGYDVLTLDGDINRRRRERSSGVGSDLVVGERRGSGSSRNRQVRAILLQILRTSHFSSKPNPKSHAGKAASTSDAVGDVNIDMEALMGEDFVELAGPIPDAVYQPFGRLSASEVAALPLLASSDLNPAELVDVTATEAVVSKARHGSEIFLRQLLPLGMFTFGSSRVFLKDGALDLVARLHRAHHALALQSFWRMARFRQRFLRLRRGVVKLQALVRTRALRRRYSAVEPQVVLLQRAIRTRVRVLAFRRMLKARIIARRRVQRFLAPFFDRKKFLRARAAAVRIQRSFRRIRLRRTIIRAAASMKILRKWLLGLIFRRRFVQRHRRAAAAALRIQRVFRGSRCLRQFRSFRTAASIIQRRLRVFIAVRTFACARKSAVIIQRFYRSYRTRKAFRALVYAIRLLQSAVRRYPLRRRFLSLKKVVDWVSNKLFNRTQNKALMTWQVNVSVAARSGDAATLQKLLFLSNSHVQLSANVVSTELSSSSVSHGRAPIQSGFRPILDEKVEGSYPSTSGIEAYHALGLGKKGYRDYTLFNNRISLRVRSSNPNNRLSHLSPSELVNIRLKSEKFRSILHLCCFSGSLECVKVALSVGASPMALDTAQGTPLHALCANGLRSMDARSLLRSLLELFSNPQDVLNHRTTQGLNCLDLALQAAWRDPKPKDFVPVLQDLVSFGAKSSTPLHRNGIGNGFGVSIGALSSRSTSTESSETSSHAPLPSPPSLNLSTSTLIKSPTVEELKIQQIVDTPDADELARIAVAIREQELLKRRKKEMVSDPHYQLQMIMGLGIAQRAQASKNKSTPNPPTTVISDSFDASALDQVATVVITPSKELEAGSKEEPVAELLGLTSSSPASFAQKVDPPFSESIRKETINSSVYIPSLAASHVPTITPFVSFSASSSVFTDGSDITQRLLNRVIGSSALSIKQELPPKSHPSIAPVDLVEEATEGITSSGNPGFGGDSSISGAKENPGNISSFSSISRKPFSVDPVVHTPKPDLTTFGSAYSSFAGSPPAYVPSASVFQGLSLPSSDYSPLSPISSTHSLSGSLLQSTVVPSNAIEATRSRSSSSVGSVNFNRESTNYFASLLNSNSAAQGKKEVLGRSRSNTLPSTAGSPVASLSGIQEQAHMTVSSAASDPNLNLNSSSSDVVSPSALSPSKGFGLSLSSGESGNSPFKPIMTSEVPSQPRESSQNAFDTRSRSGSGNSSNSMKEIENSSSVVSPPSPLSRLCVPSLSDTAVSSNVESPRRRADLNPHTLSSNVIVSDKEAGFGVDMKQQTSFVPLLTGGGPSSPSSDVIDRLKREISASFSNHAASSSFSNTGVSISLSSANKSAPSPSSSTKDKAVRESLRYSYPFPYIGKEASLSMIPAVVVSSTPATTDSNPPSIVKSTQQNPNWKIVVSKSTGKQYYYNTVTGATQWDIPSDFLIPVLNSPKAGLSHHSGNIESNTSENVSTVPTVPSTIEYSPAELEKTIEMELVNNLKKVLPSKENLHIKTSNPMLSRYSTQPTRRSHSTPRPSYDASTLSSPFNNARSYNRSSSVTQAGASLAASTAGTRSLVSDRESGILSARALGTSRLFSSAHLTENVHRISNVSNSGNVTGRDGQNSPERTQQFPSALLPHSPISISVDGTAPVRLTSSVPSKGNGNVTVVTRSKGALSVPTPILKGGESQYKSSITTTNSRIYSPANNFNFYTDLQRDNIIGKPGETTQLDRHLLYDTKSNSGRKTLSLGRNGWASAQDERDRVYYFNAVSGVVQWDKPDDF